MNVRKLRPIKRQRVSITCHPVLMDPFANACNWRSGALGSTRADSTDSILNFPITKYRPYSRDHYSENADHSIPNPTELYSQPRRLNLTPRDDPSAIRHNVPDHISYGLAKERNPVISQMSYGTKGW
jgi:hypothetical protein